MTDSPSHSLAGPAEPRCALILDSPHSGTAVPADMRPAVSDFDLADAADLFVDELWAPAVERGVPLLRAHAIRTYIDCNRDAADIDLDLLEGGAWPGELRPSGKAALGKALVWRTLDDGRPIYDRRLTVDEVRGRIERHHAPYHRALAERIASTHARFGASWHLDCHSMNAVGGQHGEKPGVPRADIVLGDRHGTTCDAAFTAVVGKTLKGLGYRVAVNDPFAGVELVRAHADPARRRMSLQLEVNKKLYMDEAARRRHDGFATLQRDLATLVDALLDYTAAEQRR